MNWDEIIKAFFIAALSISGGSFATHAYDKAEHQQVMDKKVMSCSEIIQLVIQNR